MILCVSVYEIRIRMNGIKSIYLRCTQQAHRLENTAMNDNNNNNADSSASWKMHIAYGDSGW